MTPDPIRSILAATDLTEASDEVLRTAGSLAAFTGADLHVLHAFELPAVGPDSAGEGFPSFQERVGDAEQAMDEQIRRTVPEAVEVASRSVEIYAPHRAIVERAEALAADVIVLGPHRRRSVAGGFLGSTADRVIRTSPVPCLVVRRHLDLPLRRVVVPFDLSHPSEGALDVALAWGTALAGRVTDGLPALDLQVVHVLPALFVHDLPSGRAVVGPELHARVEEALAGSGRASDFLVREELLWGEGPAEEITAYTGEERADLVVLATHGQGALRRALVGSVASAVARSAPCPVLLVPPALWSVVPDEVEAGSDAHLAAACL